MAEGGDCIQNRGRGRGLPYGKPTERPALRRPEFPQQTNNHLLNYNNASQHPSENSAVFTNEMAEKCIEFSPRTASSKPAAEEVVRSDVMKVPQQTPTLRHDAPEFVPRSPYLTVYNSAQAAQAENSNSRAYNAPSNHTAEEFAADSRVVNANLMGQLKELIDNLAIDPGQYDIIQESILELLINCMTSDEALKEVVNTIFSRSVTNPNLPYSGARLCNYLSQNVLSDKGEAVFRTALLSRCQNEVTKQDKLLGTVENQVWLRGMIHFIGELFIHLELTNEGTSERCVVLGIALFALLETLISNPNEENCKCVARVLKFTGSALEDDHRQNTVPMDNLMKKIEALGNNNISRSAKEQFKKILELRSSNWGCPLSPRPTREEPFVGDYNCVSTGEPVMYGPDGQPLTSEESQFLESNQRCYDDDYGEYSEFGLGEWSTEDDQDQMDDEIAAAYEEFLAQHPGCNQFQNS